MRVILSIFLFVALAFAEDSYTTKWDNIDLDQILNNDRLYQKYYQCLANKGPCTQEGQELKDVLPNALKTECSKCSEKQTAAIEKVVKFLLKYKMDDFETLEKIYDPDHVYKTKYSDEAKKRGIIFG